MLETLSHTHDPASSKIAAREHVASGRANAHKEIVFAMVKAHPFSTANELWEAASQEQKDQLKELQEVRRRLTTLWSEGRIKRTEPRACKVNGHKMVTWYCE